MLPELRPLAEQPADQPWIIADDIFIKRITIARAGTFAPQHSHVYDHVSFIAAGRARVWRDGSKGEIVEEGSLVLIQAKVVHTFETLVDRVTILCIHNAARAEALGIAEHHHL
jgi:quercetin dioxygenase-like cupin family protein